MLIKKKSLVWALKIDINKKGISKDILKGF